MARLLAIAAGDIVHVHRLIALLGDMALLATVSASSTTTLGAILGKVALYPTINIYHITFRSWDHLLSWHLRHSTFSGLGGSSQSEALWPD